MSTDGKRCQGLFSRVSMRQLARCPSWPGCGPAIHAFLAVRRGGAGEERAEAQRRRFLGAGRAQRAPRRPGPQPRHARLPREQDRPARPAGRGVPGGLCRPAPARAPSGPSPAGGPEGPARAGSDSAVARPCRSRHAGRAGMTRVVRFTPPPACSAGSRSGRRRRPGRRASRCRRARRTRPRRSCAGCGA